MTLVNLAKQKKLPQHQYMDCKTINWIIKNNPFSHHEREDIFKKTEINCPITEQGTRLVRNLLL